MLDTAGRILDRVAALNRVVLRAMAEEQEQRGHAPAVLPVAHFR